MAMRTVCLETKNEEIKKHKSDNVYSMILHLQTRNWHNSTAFIYDATAQIL